MKNDFIRNKNFKNQPKKAVKKTFSFYALVFALLFMFVGSILGSIAFVRTCNIDTHVNVAYADSVETDYFFKGSNIYAPFGGHVLDTQGRYSHPSTDYIGFMSFSASLRKESLIGVSNNPNLTLPNCPFVSYTALEFYTTGSLRPFNTKPYLDTVNGYVNYEYPNNIPVCSYAYNINSSGQNVNVSNAQDLNNFTIIYYTNFFSHNTEPYISSSLGARVDTYIQYGFSNNVVSVRFYGTLINPSSYGTNTVNYINHIVYTDSNNYTCDIAITSYIYNRYLNNLEDFLVFDDRTYYLNDADINQEFIIQSEVNKRVDEIKNDYINQINTANGKYNTLLNQLPDIKQSEFERGKLQGAAESNNYSFLSLIGSLFDAPIQAVSGLLNFDVLGFNLWNFFTAVITIGIVIFVVRLFL